VLTTQQTNKPSPVEEFDQPKIQADKRKDERITSHATLIVSLFSTRFHHEYASMTFNHSKGGMCLEAAEPFRPRSVLFIRFNNATDNQIYHEKWKYLRTSTLAEVKWSRECRDKFSTYYRLGVKYY
jgi:hypothetical protein